MCRVVVEPAMFLHGSKGDWIIQFGAKTRRRKILYLYELNTVVWGEVVGSSFFMELCLVLSNFIDSF